MNNKTLIKVAKVFGKNSVLPIIETAKCTGNEITFTDLETEVVIPYHTGINVCIPISNLLPVWETFKEPVYGLEVIEEERIRGGIRAIEYTYKVSMSEGKQSIKVHGMDTANFPVSREKQTNQVGVITGKMMPTLLDALDFVSKDNLSPAMLCIEVSDHIAATDAHRLIYEPIETPFTTPILLITNVVKLMDIIGGEWTVYHDTEKQIITLCNEDNVRIAYRAMDAKYPQWRLVVPEITSKTPTAKLNTKEWRKAIKMGAKFGNVAKMGVLHLNGNASYHVEDIDYATEYDTEISAIYKEEIKIAFNWSFLDNILGKCPDQVTMKYWGPGKAAIFEGKYLLMPLMLPE